MTTISLATPWNVLLDIASEGGLEPTIVIGGSARGSLAFQIWLDGATPAGLEAANIATKLFDMGGEASHEIFEHCFALGSVYREYADHEPIQFKGPVAGSLSAILAESSH